MRVVSSEAGGILFVNKWCNPKHATIKEQICTKDNELLVVSLRPHYLPREFTVVLAILVYIPPSANAEVASDVVLNVITRLQTRYPDSFICMSGDYNHVSLSKTLPTFSSMWTVQRGGKRPWTFCMQMQKMHTNAYKCTALPLIMTWCIPLPPTPQLLKGYLSSPKHLNAGILKQMKHLSAVLK